MKKRIMREQLIGSLFALAVAGTALGAGAI